MKVLDLTLLHTQYSTVYVMEIEYALVVKFPLLPVNTSVPACTVCKYKLFVNPLFA